MIVLKNIAEYLDMFHVWIELIIGSILVFSFLKWYFRKEFKIYKNLKRSIYIFTFGSDNFNDTELLIKKSCLFHCPSFINNSNEISIDRVLQEFDNFSLFILGYDESISIGIYQKIISSAQERKIPVIVFTKDNRRITPEHKAIFDRYNFFEMCNTNLRLLSLLYTLCVVLPKNT